MTQLAPPEVRCTAVALGYNITLGVVGGISPMVATWLVHRTNEALSPALLIAVGAAISFLAIARRREKRQAIAQVA
jgi:MFS transporter, MHS family, proline/betaine transporter